MKKLPLAEITLIVLGSILYFLANIQRVAVPGAVFDLLQNDLNTTAQNITALGSWFMYIYAISQLIIGILIARFGGFRVVTIGAVLFFSGSLLFPFAHAITLLYFSRILIGLGSATFYLGMINETRKVVSKNNFGVVLSLILFVGYLGGILANAPLIYFINNLTIHLQVLGFETSHWRELFLIFGCITAVIVVAFILIKMFLPKQPVDETVHFNLELFKETFSNKKNHGLYIFSCLNYGLYYVVQTIWGKKFLEDFFSMSEMKAAIVLSIMGALYAVAGSIIALTSKVFLNRRTIFLKIFSFNTLLTYTTLLIFVCCNFNTTTANYIAVFLFCAIAFGASISPLLVPLLHDYNGPRVANTSVSVMTASFYLVVAILGNISGFFFDIFAKNNSAHPSILSYISLFGLMTILAIIAFVNVFKIEESKKTQRLLNHINYVKDKNQEDHWHDEYEHDLYTNV